MYFLHRKDTDTYITIHKEDEANFKNISQSDFFNTENKFQLIKDKTEIRNILEDRFSSKNRGEDYSVGLPSSTLVSSSLFPYNLDKRSHNNKIALLKWNNDIDSAELKSQRIKNKLSTDSGTYIHKILELALLDKNTRIYDKTKSLNKYIEIANSEKEIVNLIDNFNDRKDYFTEIASKTLSKFFENELNKLDPICNELFVKNQYIQGAIDAIVYKNKRLYLTDWKTSKKSMSKNQVPDKGYLRQLYIYSRLLLDLGIISKQEYKNLGFQIYFFNWNSGNSAVYEFDKSEVDKSKGYVDFILSWYWSIKKDEDITISL